MYVIRLCDALDGPKDTKSPIAFGVGLGEGMPPSKAVNCMLKQ